MPVPILYIAHSLRFSCQRVLRRLGKESRCRRPKKQSLAEIWNDPLIHEFHLAHLKGKRDKLPAGSRCTYLYTTPDNVDELSPTSYLSRCQSPMQKQQILETQLNERDH